VAVIGDSTTDGNGVAINSDARWPDFLAARLAPYGVAVINAGISGARLLSDKMGVNALARFQRDVLDQPGVSTAVVLVGINDISWPGTAFDPKGHRPTLEMLEAGYQQLVAQAHRRKVRVIGVTIMPFKGALEGTPLNNYFEPDKDAMRQELNTSIRNSGVFDGVLDFDLWARDPADPARLNHTIDSGDHLHPGNRGNKLLADAIPLHVLVPELAKTTNDR
jgi:lysophospholipase L1-like esterase